MSSNGKLNYFQTRPKVSPINIRDYLERLGLKQSLADLHYLKQLHRAHLLHIPFENLDIHYRRPISLSVKDIYQKVIYQKRGGLCYELNALFFHLLVHLGYDAYLGAARVYLQDGLTPDLDHMIVLVMLPEGQFLCDVGFGNLFSEPKLLKRGQPFLDYTTYFRFDSDPDDHWVLSKSSDGIVYEKKYNFEIKPRELIEFMPRCTFHQSSMESPFKQLKQISQLTPTGRVTLTEHRLKITAYGETLEKTMMNENEFLAALQQHFGLDPLELIHQQAK